jgi:hypothetical protein
MVDAQSKLELGDVVLVELVAALPLLGIDHKEKGKRKAGNAGLKRSASSS